VAVSFVLCNLLVNNAAPVKQRLRNLCQEAATSMPISYLCD
jgi:hypothetical protein